MANYDYLFSFDDDAVERTQRYITEVFVMRGISTRLVSNILHYVSLQGMDLEDTLRNLEFLLDGVGISRQELTRCLLGDEKGEAYEA